MKIKFCYVYWEEMLYIIQYRTDIDISNIRKLMLEIIGVDDWDEDMQKEIIQLVNNMEVIEVSEDCYNIIDLILSDVIERICVLDIEETIIIKSVVKTIEV